MRTLCFLRWWGALWLMWFWSVKLEVWNFTRNILRNLVGLMQKIFCCLAGLGEEGSIQQIAGPREDYASKFVQGKRGKSPMQSLSSSGERPYQGKSLLHPAGDIFILHLWHTQDGCNTHVNNEDAGKSHAIPGMACCHALWMHCASGGYHWWCQRDGTPKARPATQLFVARRAFHVASYVHFEVFEGTAR